MRQTPYNPRAIYNPLPEAHPVTLVRQLLTLYPTHVIIRLLKDETSRRNYRAVALSDDDGFQDFIR